MKAFAISVAKKAGVCLLRHFRKDPRLLLKRGTAKSITTRYDLECNAIIVKEISRRYPHHNILTEESGFRDRKSNYTWIIDPLDGSSNYANGNPFFSVSIALAKDGQLVVGVVFAPYLKELFVAEKGKGAYLNGKRLRVSPIAAFSKSYFLTCEGGERTNKRIAVVNKMFHGDVADLRKLGSAALESAYVAAGRVEAYISLQINSWDIAAGALLVEEAGGKVTDFAGKSWTAKAAAMAKKADLVFSNRKLHRKILKELKE